MQKSPGHKKAPALLLKNKKPGSANAKVPGAAGKKIFRDPQTGSRWFSAGFGRHAGSRTVSPCTGAGRAGTRAGEQFKLQARCCLYGSMFQGSQALIQGAGEGRHGLAAQFICSQQQQ